jgi:tRNA modification GTPase
MACSYILPVTPPGEGGIGVIHLISPKATDIILGYFKPKNNSINKIKSNRLYFGYFQDRGKIIDEVIINYIPKRESFSGIDTIEINSHGGIMPAKSIIEVLIKEKAKRISESQLIELALKNKQLTQIQKEALLQLMDSTTLLSARVFLDQYNGCLKKSLIKHKNSKRNLAELLKSSNLGFALTNPKRILITGRPNTGKSTLFNLLVGKERAIVHHTPGTTRDLVDESIAIKEIPFKLMDSAGWRIIKGVRSPQEMVESLGIKKLKQELRKTDIVICLVDGSSCISNDDIKIINHLKNRNVIWVINKCDLPQKLSSKFIPAPRINISALKQKGIDSLNNEIIKHAGINLGEYKAGAAVVFTKRQYDTINSALGRLRQS